MIGDQDLQEAKKQRNKEAKDGQYQCRQYHSLISLICLAIVHTLKNPTPFLACCLASCYCVIVVVNKPAF
jgi:hypothetical protein